MGGRIWGEALQSYDQIGLVKNVCIAEMDHQKNDELCPC